MSASSLRTRRAEHSRFGSSVDGPQTKGNQRVPAMEPTWWAQIALMRDCGDSVCNARAEHPTESAVGQPRPSMPEVSPYGEGRLAVMVSLADFAA